MLPPRIIFIFILLCAGLTHLFAQVNDKLRVYHLQDSIYVFANRYEYSQRTTINPVDVIDVKKYSELATHSVLQLVDMLSPDAFVLDKKILGFGVGPAGGGILNMRGMGGKPNSGILVLINGRPDFMGIFGHPLPDVYGLENVERIEVVKGPSSTLFGSGALGGVVNLVSGNSPANRISLKTEAGNYSTYRQGAAFSYSIGRTTFHTQLIHGISDGHIDSSGFDNWNFLAGIHHSFSQSWSLVLNGRYVPYHFEDPSMGQDVANLGTYAKIRRGMMETELTGDIGKLSNSFHLYSNLGHHRFNDGFESNDFTYGFSSYQHYKYSHVIQLSFGLDALYYGGRAKNVVFPKAPPKSDLNIIKSVGAYLLTFYSPTPRWNFKIGARKQNASLKVNRFLPTAAISYFPSYNFKLYANYSNGFRLPTLQELYLFPSSNKNLQPEDVKSYEFGGSFYADNKNFLEVSYFQNHIKNNIEIIKNPVAPPPVVFANSGRAFQWGVESKLVFAMNSLLNGQLSYSYLNPDHLTAYNPQNMFKYLINIDLQKLNLILFGKYIKDIYGENFRKYKLADYHIVNLSGAYPLHSFRLSLQLRNLFNRKYEILPGYPAPGFSFLVGLSYSLDFNR